LRHGRRNQPESGIVACRQTFSLKILKSRACALLLFLTGNDRRPLLLQSVFLFKLIDASTGINEPLNTCVIGMTLGTYLYFNIFLCATCFYNVTTSTANGCLLVFGMDFFFHGSVTFFLNQIRRK